MSYLPRMSKTYKEPQEPIFDEPEDNLSVNTVIPASPLLNEKTYNPQMVLRHYRYLPHPLPVLPGPSLLEELLENEIFVETTRMKRSTSQLNTEPQVRGKSPSADSPSVLRSEVGSEETESKRDVTEKVKRTHSKKIVKGSKSAGRKKSSKTIKKENLSSVTVNPCEVVIEKPFTAIGLETKTNHRSRDSGFLSKDELNSLKREKSVLPITNETLAIQKPPAKDEPESGEKQEIKQKEFTNRSVQCTIFGSLSRMFVIPPIINSLLRSLAFLLHEINREEAISNTLAEKKFLMTQIQLLLGDLCNQKVEKDFGFDITYSDFKRLEKISGEFQKYTKDVYGDKGEYIDRMEDLKRVFTESKKKEMELAVLTDKLQKKEEKKDEEEEEEEEFLVKESDLKSPEITLQNKRLESEQLTAEVEFSSIEMKKTQKAIAELDWDIRNLQEQMVSLKKSAGSKSKIEVIGRKSSAHKLSAEVLTRGSKSRECDITGRKKI